MVHPKPHTARYRVPWVMGLYYNKAVSSAPHTVPLPSILRQSPFPSIPQNRAPHSHHSRPAFSHGQVDARSSSQIYFCSGWLSAPPQPGHSTMSCPKTSSQPWGGGPLAFGTASRTPGYTSQLGPPPSPCPKPGCQGLPGTSCGWAPCPRCGAAAGSGPSSSPPPRATNGKRGRTAQGGQPQGCREGCSAAH